MIALTTVVVLAMLALLHVYWGLGGRIGWLAVLPEVDSEPAFVPSELASFAVAAGLAAAALVVAAAGGLLPVGWPPASVLRWACYAFAGLFALRAVGDFRWVGFSKRVRGTRFARWDTALFSPLCLLLAAGFFAVAWNAVP